MRTILLETYVAILETGSTRAAARLLKVSQSAVSRRLGQLEEALGLKLFIRDKTQLIPTKEGQVIQASVKNLLDRSKRLFSEARDLRTGNSSALTLTVAFPASLTLTIVPAIVSDFLSKNTRVRLDVLSGSYETIERMLLDERAELGFVGMPFSSQELNMVPLVKARTVCVMHKDHQMSNNGEIKIRDLSNQPLIMLGKGRAGRRETDLLFMRAGVEPNIKVETHSVLSACGLVAAGLGIALVNELMARDYSHLPIIIRPLDHVHNNHFVFATKKGSPPSKASEDFVEATRRTLNEILGSMVRQVT